jgi:hypothetical protein
MTSPTPGGRSSSRCARAASSACTSSGWRRAAGRRTSMRRPSSMR